MKINMQKLNQVRVKMPVYETKDYSIFKRLEKNRAVTESRTKKLIASLGEKALDIPIVCNENLEIIDGQGRYEARKALRLPIQFIMIKGLDIDDCARLNRYNQPWKPKDWINIWAKNEDPDIAGNYIRLTEFMRIFSMGYQKALKLAGRKNNENVIEDGKVKFTQEDAEKAKECIDKGNEILEALCYNGRTNDAFWSAVRVCINTEGYDHARMIEKCKKNRSSYNQMSALEAQLTEFTRIYNKDVKNKKKAIYFQDYMRNRGYNVRTYEEQKTKEEEADISTLERKEAEEATA